MEHVNMLAHNWNSAKTGRRQLQPLVRRQRPSQILRLQSGVPRDTREHLGPDLVFVMKGEGVVRPALAGEGSMRSDLTLNCPADPEERRQHPPRLGRGPGAHAALKVTLSRSGAASPCSKRSASTRSARACTCAIASSRLVPYVRTPGSSGTSAIQR